MRTIIAIAGGALLGYWLAKNAGNITVPNQGAQLRPVGPHQPSVDGWPVSFLSPRLKYVNPNSRIEAKMRL